MNEHKTVATPGVAIVLSPITFSMPTSQPQGPLDMTMTDLLNHNSEGENVLYADGHVVPTTQPFAGENRGQNSNTWLNNIYTVQTGKIVTTGGVGSGLPYDDKDAIMLPTAN